MDEIVSTRLEDSGFAWGGGARLAGRGLGPRSGLNGAEVKTLPVHIGSRMLPPQEAAVPPQPEKARRVSPA